MAWIEAYETPIPMLFDSLLNAAALPSDVATEISELLVLKRASSEKEYGAPMPAIHAYIAARVDSQSPHLVPTRTPEATKEARAAVKEFFLSTLKLTYENLT